MLTQQDTRTFGERRGSLETQMGGWESLAQELLDSVFLSHLSHAEVGSDPSAAHCILQAH